MMLERSLAVALAASLAAAPAAGAELTDVADAADTVIVDGAERDDPFDLFFGAGFRMNLANGKITREPIVRDGVTLRGCGAQADGSPAEANARDCLAVDEMRWIRNTSILDINLQVGIFWDLAATIDLHYVFSDFTALRYAKGVTPSVSSVDPQTGNTDETLFPLGPTAKTGFRSKYVGWGNIDEFGYRTGGMDFGVRWAPLSEERDSSKPMWVLSVVWSNPYLASTFDPRGRASEENPGSVGDGTHYLTFATALSKRIANFGLIGIDPNVNRRGYIDPYMEVSFTLPLPQKGLALRELTRSTDRYGRAPPFKTEFNGGMEVVAFENLRRQRKVAIDVGLRSAFVSDGRSYNMLSDALDEVTFSEDFFNITGVLAVYIQAAEFLRFKAGVSVGYNNEHFLTFEEVGDDRNGDGQVLPPEFDPAATKDLINPYFCGNDDQDKCSTQGLPSYDQVGFRFKDEEHVIVSWFATLWLTF
jgi:hypothetical protein